MLIHLRRALGLAAVGLLCGCLLALLLQLPVVRASEVRAHDRLLRAWRTLCEADTRGILLVTLDQETLDQNGCAWPVPHALYGRLAETLAAAGAQVIGFAVHLDRRDTLEDQGLEEVLARCRVVLAQGSRSFAVPSGSAALQPDADGLLRTFAPQEVSAQGSQPCLALAMLRLAVHDPNLLPRGFAGDAGTRYRIAFAGPPEGTFATLSAAKVLSGADCSPQVRGRLVLIGTDLPGLEAPLRTPLTVSEETLESSLGVQAHILQTLQGQTPLVSLDSWGSGSLVAGAFFLLLQVLARVPVPLAVVLASTAMVLYLTSVLHALIEWQLLLPVWGPLVAISLALLLSLVYRAARLSMAFAFPSTEGQPAAR